MRRGYIVLESGNLDDEGDPESPILLQTTCHRQVMSYLNGHVVLPICGEKVTVEDSCNGCSVYCNKFSPSKKG